MLVVTAILPGNGVGHINKVKLRGARLVLGLVINFGGYTVPAFFRPLCPPPLGLAISPWIGAMSSDDGFGHHWEKRRALRNRTADILAYCMLA